MDRGGRIIRMRGLDGWVGQRLGDAAILIMGLALAMPLILPFA